MVKIGKFKGLEVYAVSQDEWQEMTTNTENLWVVGRKKVYYHDQMVAWLNSRNELQDFDEELFEYLRDKYSKKNKCDVAVKEVADEEPQSASEVVYESVDPAAAVNSFMDSWESNIDNEIAVLKNAVSAMEDEFNAVG